MLLAEFRTSYIVSFSIVLFSAFSDLSADGHGRRCGNILSWCRLWHIVTKNWTLCIYSCRCHVLLAEFRTSANSTGFFVFGLTQEFAQLHSKFFNKPLHNRTKSVNFDHEILLHYFFQKLNAAVVILVCWTRLSLFLVCFCIPSFPVCFGTPSFFGMFTCLVYAIYSTNFALFTKFRSCKVLF